MRKLIKNPNASLRLNLRDGVVAADLPVPGAPGSVGRAAERYFKTQPALFRVAKH